MQILLKEFIWAVMWVIGIAYVLMFMTLCSVDIAKAEEYHLLEPSRVTTDFYQVKQNRDSYLRLNAEGSTRFGESDEYWTRGAAMNVDYDILRYGDYAWYWKNKVHMAATNVAVRHVGWEYELGARLGKSFDVFWYHHSEHVMDLDREDRFPLRDYYGFRFVLIETGRK